MKIFYTKATFLSLLFCAIIQSMENATLPVKTATVRHGNGISLGECNYLQKRLPIARAALEKMLNCSLEGKKCPSIAFVTSGGGYRAMLCTIGSLCGAQKIGLLDTASYITSLSGSTWAVAPWISTGIPLKMFKQYIQECISKSFFELTDTEKNLIETLLLSKYEHNQPRTLVDLYGALLANRLLDATNEAKQTITLSQQKKQVKNAGFPYPIYTAVDGKINDNGENYSWYEFTPHEISSITHHTHIPTWSYGATFNNGTATTIAPEQSLGFNMGTWGAAFAASIHEIVNKLGIDNSPHTNFLMQILHHYIGEDRPLPFWAKVPNFMYEIDQDIEEKKHKHLRLVDAGLDFNLPYAPVSGINPERSADILIFLDASAGNLGEEFKKCVEYAHRHQLAFPSVDFTDIDKKTISIFKDEFNPAVPLVFYMPPISDEDLWERYKVDPSCKKYNLSGFDLNYETNSGFCETIHFQYTSEHSTLVTNQMEFNMRANKDAIAQAIEWKINTMQ